VLPNLRHFGLCLRRSSTTDELVLSLEQDMVSARASSRRMTGTAGVSERRSRAAGVGRCYDLVRDVARGSWSGRWRAHVLVGWRGARELGL
jgi:hypothetical protein